MRSAGAGQLSVTPSHVFDFMTSAVDQDLKSYCYGVARAARAASADLAQATGSQKNGWLRASAAMLRRRSAEILAANALDIAAAPGFG